MYTLLTRYKFDMQKRLLMKASMRHLGINKFWSGRHWKGRARNSRYSLAHGVLKIADGRGVIFQAAA